MLPYLLASRRWIHGSLVVLASAAILPPTASVAAAQTGGAGGTSAGPGTAERCRAAAFREFDFWLGSWEVRSAEGELLGHNEIRLGSGGCSVIERWRGLEGGTGVSVNTFDADLGQWTQRWVGVGANLWLRGGMEDGPGGPRMILRGVRPRSTPGGDVLDRLAWRPLPDGRVEQVWEVSSDEGRTWTEVFRGLYTRTAPETGPEVVARQPEGLEWREAPSGAAFATLYGNPADAGAFALRMRMPPRFEMDPHLHDAAEHVTVLSGTLRMRFSADGEVLVLPAGSVVSIPAGVPMWGWTAEEETVIQIQGVGPFGTTRLDPGGMDGGRGAGPSSTLRGSGADRAVTRASWDLEAAFPDPARSEPPPDVFTTRLHFRACPQVLAQVRSHLRAALEGAWVPGVVDGWRTGSPASPTGTLGLYKTRGRVRVTVKRQVHPAVAVAPGDRARRYACPGGTICAGGTIPHPRPR